VQVMLIGSLVMMFRLSWQMTTLTFIVLPLITIISKIYGDFFEVGQCQDLCQLHLFSD
jgi:ABC-type multidrug transport system fused ATPase/permease subunit